MRFAGRFWREVMASVARARGGIRDRRAEPVAPGGSDDIREICRTLLRTRGEASVVTLARAALDAFAGLEESGRREFFGFLTHELGPEPAGLDRAVDDYRAAPGPGTATALSRAAEPPRRELLALLNTSPNGMSDLLAMREALLDVLPEHPELEPLDADFLYLLRAWFNRGFLDIRRIDWRTPAFVLEKIIEYEAVHQILDWEDLQRRLEADRRCFGFFHPSLPDEPLIFVEVALCKGLASSVQDLIFGEVNPDVEADTAVFYSISNCQRGLVGISFGKLPHQAGGARACGRDAGSSHVRDPVADPRLPEVAGPGGGGGTVRRGGQSRRPREPGLAGRRFRAPPAPALRPLSPP